MPSNKNKKTLEQIFQLLMCEKEQITSEDINKFVESSNPNSPVYLKYLFDPTTAKVQIKVSHIIEAATKNLGILPVLLNALFH